MSKEKRRKELFVTTIIKSSSISFLNISSIIAWKVARELHILKNMTVGSYSPWFVLNAAFYSSPD
jgi:hypothetical protein